MGIFQQVKKVRISDTVVDQIVSYIEDGTLKPGDYLPSERELVNQMGVARASVREALRMLEYQGIIEVQSGKGAFVVSDVKSADEEVVHRWFQVHAGEYLELMEIRESLEVLSASLAARKATDEDIKPIYEIINDSKNALEVNDVESLVSLDRQFHHLLAKASGNNLLSHLIDMTIEALVVPRYSLFHIKERAKISWSQHNEILDAIIQRNPQLVEERMRNHNNSVRIAIASLQDSRNEG